MKQNHFRAHSAEAEARWGHTEAYREYSRRAAHTTQSGWDALAAGMDGIFADFAACAARGEAPGSEEARAIVQALKDFITGHLYTCTDEILAGLGQMYVQDERFRKNINKHGEGTAEFAEQAIRAYVDAR